MSGQPTKNPLDAERFRKEYLKTLSQKEANNQKNLSANQLFIKTGAPQQPLDTRSASERLANLEALKPEIRSKLLQLMDGGEAEKVVQNASTEQLLTMSQAMPYLISTLKPKWSKGMYADIFLSELDKYIKSVKAPAVDSNQMLMKEDIAGLKGEFENIKMANASLRRAIMEKLIYLEMNLPSREELTQLNMMPDKVKREMALSGFQDAMSSVPTKEQLKKDIDDLSKKSRMGDFRGVESSATRLNEEMDLAGELDAGFRQVMANIVAPSADVSVYTGYISKEEISKKTLNQLNSYVRDLILKAHPKFLKDRAMSLAKLKTASQMKGFLIENDDAIRSLLTGSDLQDKDLNEVVPVPNLQMSVQEMEPPSGMGIMRKKCKGTGLKRVSDLKNEDIDWKAGIAVPKAPRFIPFGRFVIHKGNLEKDIISLKTPCGACLNDLKSQRVSSRLGGMVRKIVGGGVPTFDEISAMSEDEKGYLHKLASRANILDRLSIPAPDKKKDQIDTDQFEIMKGEIMSGNDSAELIKKFKFLIIKLMGKKLLPARQAKDLLFELASLGY